MIDKKTICAIHQKVLLHFGGADGIRSEAMLESALARPMHLKNYAPNATLFDEIAVLVFGIIKNHSFVDGNKRVGAVVCDFILRKNGYVFKATEKEKYAIYMGIATGQLTEKEYADWIKAHCLL